MNATRRKLSAVFAPETRFDVTPVASAPFRATLETEFERLLRRDLKDLLHRTANPELNLLYRHAANETAALASATGFPSLVWPLLFAEKTDAARRYAERQACIRARSAEVAEEVLV